jgi:hypothetical protein
MNENADRSPGRRRAGVLAAGLAGIALLAAACSGSPAAPASKAYQKALAFTQCMRSHGAPTFPDPSSQGAFDVSQIDVNSPLILSAASACKRLMPPNAVQPPAAQNRELVSQALNYAACMRSQGIPNFPDPKIQNGGSSVEYQIPAGADPNSPVFLSAGHLCHKLFPGAGA